MRRLLAFFAMVFSVLAVIFFAIPSIQNPTLGIEFQGGYEIVYTVSQKDDSPIPNATDIADVIAQRIDIAGVKNPQVNTENVPNSDDVYIRVCVTSKNTSELAGILTLIESDTEVVFTDSDGNIKMYGNEVLKDEDGAILSYRDGQAIVLLNIKDTSKFASVTSELSGQNMMAWIGYQGPSDSYIGDAKAYKGEGTAEQQAAAAKKLIVNATVSSEINSETAEITGSFSANEASQIGKLLSAGSMNFTLNRTDLLKVDGAYGASAFNQSIIAGLVGLICIMIMMIAIYRIPGIVSSITLAFYTAAILLVFNLIGGEYGPDTIAAIVIGLGMAVDCCIILFERLNDELYKGRSVRSAYEESTKKSLSSILDSNITTIIAAAALYFFGKRSVKGFATMLLVTTVFNVIIMLLVTRLLMFLLIKSGKLDNKKNLFGVNVKKIPDISKGEQQTYFGPFAKFNFMKNTKKIAVGYGIFILIGVICFGLSFAFGAAGINYGNGHGLNFGLDFLDGTTATINISDVERFLNTDECLEGFEQLGTVTRDNNNKIIGYTVTEEDVIRFLGDGDGGQLGYPIDPESVSIVGGINESGYNSETKKYELTIKVEYMSSSEDFYQINNFEDQLENVLNLQAAGSDYADYVTISQQSTSPTMALATVINALLSLLVAFALIIIYIAIRFRYTYALASVCALLLDCLFMLAFFAIFQVEVQTEFVSAVLAIIGYSINDTVVIFDRIREISKETNYGKLDENSRYDIVNKALQNTTTRSLWTTVSTMIPVLALIFIGSESTTAFCLAMLAGLISGIFTSIFFAPSLWLIFEKRHMMKLREKALKDAAKPQTKTGPEELTVVGIND